MRKKLVVLDFDGTISDAEAEGQPAVQGYQEDLCALLGKKLAEMSPVLQVAQTEIAANPGGNGWLYNGLIVAPATVDPYLRMMAVARKVLDHFGVFIEPSDRERLLGFLYTNNYSLSGMVFKDGSAELLTALHEDQGIDAYVVTNSHTEGVKKKIDKLEQRMSNHVIGGAKKYVVDGRPEHISESINLHGLTRPIYLRRSAYYEILEQLRADNGVEWQDVTVIGDIFELDLALPFALGAKIGLVLNQFTPQYEQEFVTANQGRATLIRSLSEVMPFVMG